MSEKSGQICPPPAMDRVKSCGELLLGQAWIFHFSNILNWNQYFFHVPSCEHCEVFSETFHSELWNISMKDFKNPSPPLDHSSSYAVVLHINEKMDKAILSWH